MDNILKKLSRLEILELMLAQSERLEKTERRLEASKHEIDSYKQMIANLQNTLSANVLLLKEQESRILSLRSDLDRALEHNEELSAKNNVLEKELSSGLSSEQKLVLFDEEADRRFKELELELVRYRQEMEEQAKKHCEQLIKDTERLCQFRIIDKNADILRLARLILENKERFERILG